MPLSLTHSLTHPQLSHSSFIITYFDLKQGNNVKGIDSLTKLYLPKRGKLGEALKNRPDTQHLNFKNPFRVSFMDLLCKKQPKSIQ